MLSILRLAEARHIAFSIALLLAILIGLKAFGKEATDPSRLMKFDISEQPLLEALQAYSLTTGVQAMFETKSVLGYRSAPVKGEFTPGTALRILLSHTDLKIRYTRASALVLAPASAPNVDDPPNLLAPADMSLGALRVTETDDVGRRGELGAYVASVQADIQKALEKALHMRGDYRVGMRLWIDQSRTVQRAELFDSTGDHDRDNAVAGAVQGLVLSQKTPSHAPQPLLFMITIHAL